MLTGKICKKVVFWKWSNFVLGDLAGSFPWLLGPDEDHSLVPRNLPTQPPVSPQNGGFTMYRDMAQYGHALTGV